MDFSAIAVGSFMVRDIVCVSTDTSLIDARETLVQHGVSGAPVVDKVGQIVGVFSKSDLLREETFDSIFEKDGSMSLSSTSAVDLSGRFVGEVISPKLITASEEDSAADVAQLMVKHSVHRVVIVAENKPIGMVSALDVLKLV